MIKKHYVGFFYRGILSNEISPQEISSCNLKEVKVPDGAFGFQLFDIVLGEVEVDGEKIELSSKRLNISPMHYYGGHIYTKAEVEATVSNNEILLREMRDNNWEKVIQTRTENFQHFDDEKDIFVKEE